MASTTSPGEKFGSVVYTLAMLVAAWAGARIFTDSDEAILAVIGVWVGLVVLGILVGMVRAFFIVRREARNRRRPLTDPRDEFPYRELAGTRSVHELFAEMGEPSMSSPQGNSSYSEPASAYISTESTPSRHSLELAISVLGLCCLALIMWLVTWHGLRNVLETYETRRSLGPGDAPDILIALSGASALVTAVSLAISRLFRAWGAKNKDNGSGSESDAKGRAEIIKAEGEVEARITLARAEAEVTVIKARAEAEAATTRAIAELRTADAEYLRAEKGIEPLPAAGADGLPALGAAPSLNGNAGTPALPPGGSPPNPN
ncbi:hypothetical protein [Streptomyces tauricus]|uniref:hypothetical protein n=1 Tax=Streptomyces tauricus TaxID=68274 RepID=UPI002244AB96|nr:hypothetical protein [Streptomyces tauricus]MCW8103231.1 hypothetical protein [Streptomyces tauricus]